MVVVFVWGCIACMAVNLWLDPFGTPTFTPPSQNNPRVAGYVGNTATALSYFSGSRKDRNKIPATNPTPPFSGGGVEELKGAIVERPTIRCNRKAGIQNGGRETGSFLYPIIKPTNCQRHYQGNLLY